MSEDPLRPQDHQLLARIAAGNGWLRSVLCTLARMGTGLRHEDPERAAAIVRELGPWPWFKAGQFLFDLLEWEDFMVDGPPPDPLPTVLQPESWRLLEDLLERVRGLLDAAQQASTGATEAAGAASRASASTGAPAALPLAAVVARFSSRADLPPLEPGLHLYRDVVLGVWASAALGVPDAPAEENPPG